jgi:hypothetical protein
MSDKPKPFGDIMREDLVLDPWKGEKTKFFLSDMAEDYVFFNHGAFFTICRDTFADGIKDPLSDWYAQAAGEATILREPFGRAIFAGLDAPSLEGRGTTWNQIICGVNKEIWPDLLAFLGGIRLLDEKKRLLYSAFSAKVDVPDPGVIDQKGLLAPSVPRVDVHVFCVETNKDRWELQAPANSLGCPKLVRVTPRQEIVAQADAALAGDLQALALEEGAAMDPFLQEYARVQREGPKIIGPDDANPI